MVTIFYLQCKRATHALANGVNSGYYNYNYEVNQAIAHISLNHYLKKSSGMRKKEHQAYDNTKPSIASPNLAIASLA